MCGLGGGIFIVPVLSVLLGVDLKSAIAASAICVVVNSLSGTGVYLRACMVNIKLGLYLQITTTMGAIVGGLLVVYAPVNALKIVFALVLYLMIAAMVRKPPPRAPIVGAPDGLGLRCAYDDPALASEVSYTPDRIGLGMGLSSFAGLASGLLGIGGGPVQVPLMNTVMGVPLKAAAATSTFMVGVTASVSALIYYSSGLVDAALTVPAVLGILVGSQTGSRIGRNIAAASLQRVLVIVLAILATAILLEAFGIGFASPG
ncbi:MAG: sulfite exporter TauE/SafE family protein [Bradymonadaceae bacterium]|nr:sulfite exporter TauE/SafE family protein [Lujinxingiaceae bacterium]